MLTEIPNPKTIKILSAMERDNAKLEHDVSILLGGAIRSANDTWYTDTPSKLSDYSVNSKPAAMEVNKLFLAAGWDCEVFAVGGSIWRQYRIQLYNPGIKRNFIMKAYTRWVNLHL